MIISCYETSFYILIYFILLKCHVFFLKDKNYPPPPVYLRPPVCNNFAKTSPRTFILHPPSIWQWRVGKKLPCKFSDPEGGILIGGKIDRGKLIRGILIGGN